MLPRFAALHPELQDTTHLTKTFLGTIRIITGRKDDAKGEALFTTRWPATCLFSTPNSVRQSHKS